MRTTSIPVLAVAIAALLSSSALRQAFGDHTMPVETALIRFAVCLGVSWAALLLLKEFAMPNLGKASHEQDPISDMRRTLGLDDLGGYLGSADADAEQLNAAPSFDEDLSAESGASDRLAD